MSTDENYIPIYRNIVTNFFYPIVAIYFTFRNFFFNLSQIISASTGPIFTIYSPNERYLREFYLFGPFLIPQGTWSWQPILGKICEMTFIPHAGVSTRIRISKFRLTGVKGQYFCYIPCNFGEDRSINPRDFAGSFCNFGDETAKSNI